MHSVDQCLELCILASLECLLDLLLKLLRVGGCGACFAQGFDFQYVSVVDSLHDFGEINPAEDLVGRSGHVVAVQDCPQGHQMIIIPVTVKYIPASIAFYHSIFKLCVTNVTGHALSQKPCLQIDVL